MRKKLDIEDRCVIAYIGSFGGWYLTDDRRTPKKFRIAGGTVIAANGYVVFTEDDFNVKPGVEPNFSLVFSARSISCCPAL